MKLKPTLLATSLVFSVLSGCSNTPEEIVVAEQSEVEARYLEAKQLLAEGNYVRAAEILSALDAGFPFGPYSHQIQLDLIYSYYKTDNTEQALASIDRFLKLNPTHTDIDYVYYMRGLTNMKAAKNALQEMVGIDRFDRDISEHRSAFNDFNTIINQYPQSKYATDARQRMVYIKDFIAKSELAVAEYYMRRGAYVAASNRAKYVLEHLGDTDQVENALEMMLISYQELELNDLYENTYQVLKLNYPENPLVN